MAPGEEGMAARIFEGQMIAAFDANRVFDDASLTKQARTVAGKAFVMAKAFFAVRDEGLSGATISGLKLRDD